MKIKLLVAGLLLIHSWNVYAQDCNETVLLKTPGKWLEGMKGSTSGTTTADLAREKNSVDNIHKMVQKSYQPMGLDADFNGAYYSFQSEYQWANQFSYNLRLMPYYCKGTVISKAHETSTSLVIAANVITFGPEIYEPFIDASAWDEGFRSMRQMPIEKDGNYLFVENVSLGFGITGKQYTWLITFDGQLPFLWVTQKEFLERKKQKLLKGKEEEKESINSRLADLEVERKLMEKQYGNDPGKLQIYLKNSYQNVKIQQEQSIVKTEKNFLNAIFKVDELLKMPAEELSKPAIVKQDTHDFLSHLFTTSTDPFASILIKPNPAYFNKKLPKSSPQFISVVIRGDEKHPLLGKAMNELQQNLNFTQLKSMLGK